MATKKKLREEAASRLQVALNLFEKTLPARAIASIKSAQAKLAAGELSETVIEAISDRHIGGSDFDKAGRWTGKSSVDGYRAEQAERTAREAPDFAQVLQALNDGYAAGGMNDVLSTMRELVDHNTDELWRNQKYEDRKRGDANSLISMRTIEIVANEAAKRAKRAVLSDEYVNGTYELDALLNAPQKKLATPIKVPGKPSKSEADAYNAAVAIAPKKRAKKAAA